jgi:hypothetical protein
MKVHTVYVNSVSAEFTVLGGPEKLKYGDPYQ